MNSFSNVVPPGFRFHPTDEELVDYYLRKRVSSIRIDLDVIKDVDLYKIEPWDLDGICKIGTNEDQSDYYFFSHKDKKYPTGTRTNRATKAGFWKATGRDKAIYAKHCLVGMRKTLVFYKGRAPNGQKLDWIMHEYRLQTNENASPQEEGWVVCRVFKKKMMATTMRRTGDHRYESPYWYEEQPSFMPEMDSPMKILSSHNPNSSHNHPYHSSSYSCKQEQKLGLDHTFSHYTSFIDLPQLESPKIPTSTNNTSYGFPDHIPVQNYQLNIINNNGNSSNYNFMTNEEQGVEHHQISTDWRVLDKFVASQLSHEEAGEKQHNYLNNGAHFEMDHENMNELIVNRSNKVKTTTGSEFVASSSTSSGQVDQWK